MNAPLAARGANQRLTKTSTLASFAFRRPPSVEKISSIKDSASAVLQNVRKLKMLNVLTASNSSNPESSMFLSALEAPGKGASELFQRASSAPAQLSSGAGGAAGMRLLPRLTRSRPSMGRACACSQGLPRAGPR